MPATYAIDTERRLVFSRIWGAPTDDEILAHGQRLRADPCFKPDFRQLLDMTELVEIRISSQKVRQASRDQFFSPGVRRALVAHSDAAFGMARMYALASEAEGQTIRVFRELGDATAWLGESQDEVEREPRMALPLRTDRRNVAGDAAQTGQQAREETR